MIYPLIRDFILWVLRCPTGPPEAPRGSAQSVVAFRASPAYLRYRLLVTVSRVGVMGIVEVPATLFLLVSAEMGLVGKILAGAIVVQAVTKALLMVLTVRLDYDMRFYIITDRSLRIREGVWVIRETTLTFENIQNMRITQGPIQRMFGVSDLVVETAGGGGANPMAESRNESQATRSNHTGAFRGLGKPDRLRDQILAYLRQVRTSGLGEHGNAAASRRARGFSPQEVEGLRAIRDQVRQWRLEVQPTQ